MLLAGSKWAMVAEVWDSTSGEETWNPRFMTSFNDWEIDEIHNFINLTNKKKIN